MKDESVYHPQYGDGTIIDEFDQGIVEVLFSGGVTTTILLDELYSSYQEWAERNAPDHHR